MNLHHQTSGSFRQFVGGHVVAGRSDVDAGTLYDECTLGIIASRSTDSLHKSLIIAAEDGCKLSVMGAKQRVLLERLVETSKQQVLVIVLEFIGNLGPEVLQSGNLRCNGSLVDSLIGG